MKRVIAAMLCVILVPVLAGCLPSEMDLGDDFPDPPADAGADASETCRSEEYTRWPTHWWSPMWVWFGPNGQEPSCPDNGPRAFEGYDELDAPFACDPCTCDPPTGSCVLPSVLTASTVACSQPGGTLISFDAPMCWA